MHELILSGDVAEAVACFRDVQASLEMRLVMALTCDHTWARLKSMNLPAFQSLLAKLRDASTRSSDRFRSWPRVLPGGQDKPAAQADRHHPTNAARGSDQQSTV